MQEKQRLVLFDIDGTLLHGGPLWGGAFKQALRQFYPDLELPEIDFKGRTDYQILGEVFNHWGFNPKEHEERTDQILDHYLNTVEKKIQGGNPHEIQVLDGVLGLLNRLNQDHRVRSAILTGNILRGANLKLKFAELDPYFEFKVTGDDHWDRYQMPSIACSRAREMLLGQYSGKEIVIIGDTIHDVNCGKSIGVKTIAVGTGRGVDRDELLAQNPDFFFNTLADVDSVYKSILA